MVFTDGEYEVKASRVGRALSLRRLEERFGTNYPNREELRGRPVRAQGELSSAAAELAVTARERERVSALHRAEYRLELEGAELHACLDRFAGTVQGISRARQDFDHVLTLVYREPEAARHQIRDRARVMDAVQIATSLRLEPEQFGVLRAAKQIRAFGLLTVADDSKARSSAHVAAREWSALSIAEKHASKLAAEYVRNVQQQFERMLPQVFRDSTSARAAIESARVNAGIEETVRTLAQSPDRLGALRAPGTPNEVARLNWATLASLAREEFDARLITSSELAKAHAERAIDNVGERKREVRRAIEIAPSGELLERAIGRAVEGLHPAELTQLRQVLTAPQAAIVFKVQQAMRDMVLGRDEIEQ